MDTTDLNHLLAVVSTVLATVVLPADAAIPILTLLTDFPAGHYPARSSKPRN